MPQTPSSSVREQMAWEEPGYSLLYPVPQGEAHICVDIHPTRPNCTEPYLRILQVWGGHICGMVCPQKDGHSAHTTKLHHTSSAHTLQARGMHPVAWSVYGKRDTQPTLPSSSHTSPECSHSLETFRLDFHTLAMRSALRKIVPRNIFKQALEVGMGSNGQGFGCFRYVQNMFQKMGVGASALHGHNNLVL